MNILVIGGTGVLSAAVVDSCISKGYKVTMINRGNNVEFSNPAADTIICDARDADAIKEKTRDLHFDVVIDFIVFNQEQLEKSLSIFGKIADQYVFISSAQVYNTSIAKVHEEDDECPQKLWSYSTNKFACEQYLQQYCAGNNINYTIIRPGVNYDNRRIPYGVTPPVGMHYTMVARILAGKPIITWNNGQNKLNLTRVEDFAKGAVGLLGNPKAYNDSFNVVGDYVYTWKQVLDTIGKIVGKPVFTVDLPLEQYADEFTNERDKGRLLGGRACDLVCSNMKLKSIVPDYNPSVNLEQGLRMTIDWYRENNYYLGFDYKWDAEQDRVIQTLSREHYKSGFVNYYQLQSTSLLICKCMYYIEYYKNNKVIACYWRLLKKWAEKVTKIHHNQIMIH